MKLFSNLVFVILLIFQVNISNGQSNYSDDVGSVDRIIEVLYEVISGDAGVRRDWDRFENLFAEGARLIPSSKGGDGVTEFITMTPSEYKENSGEYLEKNGFFEKEVRREVEEYGSLIHVWSTYESFRSSKDSKPFMRGINSIQLLFDGKRYWVMQIYWLGETEDNPLPEKYLKK